MWCGRGMPVVGAHVEPEGSWPACRARRTSRPRSPVGRWLQLHIAHSADERSASPTAIELPRSPVEPAARLARAVPLHAHKATHIAHPRISISPYLEKHHAIGRVSL